MSTKLERFPHPSRVAPYPVWAAMRIITTLGNGMVLLWFAWAIIAIFSIINGGTIKLLPFWFGVVGLILGGGSGSSYPRPDGTFWQKPTLSLISEVLGRNLVPKECPVCGQSIFDHTPAAGYAPDGQTSSWWPSKICTNCGHDMRKRTVQ